MTDRAIDGLVDGTRIRDEIEHAFWERTISQTRHVPRVAVCYGPDNRVDFQIAGCSCGWQVPREATDPDDDVTVHVAIARSIRDGQAHDVRLRRQSPRLAISDMPFTTSSFTIDVDP
jgi:hypothetical protein